MSYCSLLVKISAVFFLSAGFSFLILLFPLASSCSAVSTSDLSMIFQVKLEGDVTQGVAYYKKALYYNWHYADAMYNLGVAYGEMLKFDMVFNLLFIHFCKSGIACLLVRVYPFFATVLA